MFIVDAQVHVWREETPERPWVPGARERMRRIGHRQEAFCYEECLRRMDEAGVDRAILVPPSWEGDRIDYSLEAAQAHPDRFGIMARVPQDDARTGAAVMREFAAIDAIKGLRLTFHRPIDRGWMVDGTSDWIWPLAEELGLPVMVYAPAWPAALGRIAQRHPDLRVIVDHMGVDTSCVDDGIATGVRATLALARHPNVSVKLSALPAHSTHPFPNANLFPYVRALIERMGPRRCHWGSDLTRLLGRGLTWRDAVEQFTVHLGLSAAELEEIMGGSLCRVLDWPSPAGDGR